MKQITRLIEVMLVGRGGDQAVGQATLGIDTNVGLHAKVPLQGLQRLMRDRSDVVIMPEAQADWLIHSLQLPLIKSPFHLRGSPSYMAWSRATYNAELAQRLMDSMQQVLASPQGKNIRDRYFH